jgi:hypothetical protein
MVDHLNCHPFYLGGDWTSSVPDVIIRMAKDGPTTQECFETVAEKVTSAKECSSAVEGHSAWVKKMRPGL